MGALRLNTIDDFLHAHNKVSHIYLLAARARRSGPLNANGWFGLCVVVGRV